MLLLPGGGARPRTVGVKVGVAVGKVAEGGVPAILRGTPWPFLLPTCGGGGWSYRGRATTTSTGGGEVGEAGKEQQEGD